ncbi:MAG: ATP-binding cassette domain-containing protein [Candidatus Aenigmarchaeota archaeon]|nr:ATP-binding cassette domain-containing protein [Candidatus Aenigmarchaeota archaeon]
MNAIEINNLTKKFNGFTAVDNVKLEIGEGEIFGLLGPNGAGKTTTISMLSTILKPTSGSATVCGYDVNGEMDMVRKSIGMVFQDPSLDDELTGRENLDFHGRLYGMNSEFRKERIDEVLKLVELESKADNLVKTYSGGMKRRLEIARGLMHFPKVLFLDEPTLGLDPQTRRNLWEYIKTINEQQKVTIILTTHYMDEADFLCNRIGIIDRGKIIALDTPDKLKEVLGGDIITLDVSQPERLKEMLEKMEYIKEINIFNKKLNIVADNGSKIIPKLIEIARENEITVDSVVLKRPSLEDVFIHYTGRTIRDEEGDGKDLIRQQMKIGWRR